MDLGALINMLGASQGQQPGAAASPMGGAAPGGFDLGGLMQMAEQLGFSPGQATDVLTRMNEAAVNGAAQPAAVEHAAAQTGMDAGLIGQLINQMMANPQMMGMATQMLDQNRDGSIMDDLAGMASRMLKS